MTHVNTEDIYDYNLSTIRNLSIDDQEEYIQYAPLAENPQITFMPREIIILLVAPKVAVYYHGSMI